MSGPQPFAYFDGKTTLRILVTGSREWTDKAVIERALGDALATYTTIGKPVLVHGAAPGADTLATVEALRRLMERGWRTSDPTSCTCTASRPASVSRNSGKRIDWAFA